MLQKMRKKSLKSKEKVTFKLQFRASNVPKSWEKLQLQVSLVPGNNGTGKATATTGKGTVKHGTCNWYEPHFECVHVSQGVFTGTVEDAEELPYKLIVATGSSLFGILGEARLNFGEYLGTAEPVSLSLPLENCKFSSVLHVELWCIIAKSRSSGRYQWTEPQESMVDQRIDFHSPLTPNGDAIARNRFDSRVALATGSTDDLHPHVMDDFGDHVFPSLSSSCSSSGRHETDNYGREEKDASDYGYGVRRWNSSDRESNLEAGSSPSRETNQVGDHAAFGDDGFSHVAGEYEDDNKFVYQGSRRWLASEAQLEAWKQQQLSNEAERRNKEAGEYIFSSIARSDGGKRRNGELEDLGEAREEKGIQKQCQVASSSTTNNLGELEDGSVDLDSRSSQAEKTRQGSNAALLSEMQALRELVQEKEVEMETSKRKESELLDLVETLRRELEEAAQRRCKQTEEKSRLTTDLTNAQRKLKEKDEAIARLERKIAYIIDECLNVNLVMLDNSSMTENMESYEAVKVPDDVEGTRKTLEEQLLEDEMEMCNEEGTSRALLHTIQLQVRHMEEMVVDDAAVRTEGEGETKSNLKNAASFRTRRRGGKSEAAAVHDPRIHGVAAAKPELGMEMEMEMETLSVMHGGRDEEELQPHKTEESTFAETEWREPDESLVTGSIFHSTTQPRKEMSLLPLQGDVITKEQEADHHPSSQAEQEVITLHGQFDQQHHGAPEHMQITDDGGGGDDEFTVMDHSNSKFFQALQQLNEMKTRTVILFRHSNHLSTTLASKENELAILKQEKLELQNALLKSSSESTDEKNLDRILALENELAEALEANDMYKSQLQSAFAKHQIVNAVALETAESAEQVIKDISRLKKENVELLDELCDLQNRYLNMSLQLAEVEAERGELVMTIRNLRSNGKLMPFQSVKF